MADHLTLEPGQVRVPMYRPGFGDCFLLRRTVLYKTGHHGSKNATLKSRGLELMTRREDLVAMVPTDETWAREKHNWQIPFGNVVGALVEACEGRVLRADPSLSKQKVLGNRPQANTPARTRWEDYKDRVRISDLFIDYIV